MEKKELKIAIVHDFLNQYGGAERVLETMSEMFPEAPIYTLLYDEEKTKGKFKNRDIRTSYLQRFPGFLRKKYQWLLPFFMVAPETFNLRDFDLVISSSGAWTKGIVTRLNTLHIAYLHSPMRFVWDYNEKYLSEFPIFSFRFFRFFARILLSYIRMWDKLAAERPDYLIANSRYTKERIKKYYRRDSDVIYPPVNVKLKTNNSQLTTVVGDKLSVVGYFLIVSRLSPYKKVDLAVETFNKLEFPLIVIGEGKQEKYLKKMAKSNIKFLGWVDDKKLGYYYAGARALIFPSDDDFGLTMAEAMGQGVPVIAYKKGGAKELIEEGKTGEFFETQTPEIIADGIRRFIENEKKYDREYIKNKAKEFSEERFKREFTDYIKKVLDN